MSKVLMLYTSSTGNTEMMVEAMLKQLATYDHHVTVKKFDDAPVEADELLKYDIIFIGIYTWAAGDLPLHVEDFYDNLHTIDLTGKIAGVFGSADSTYEQYGTAVEIIFDELEAMNAIMISDQIIVDLEPSSEEIARCKQMVDEAIEQIK